MTVMELLHKKIKQSCPNMHKTRLNSLIAVTNGAISSSEITQTGIGRSLSGESKIKHKVKRVNRLHANEKLYCELSSIYSSLSKYLLSFIPHDINIPIIIDLCYMRDDRQIQMLSADIVNKKRSLPLYRDVFYENNLKKRASSFIAALKSCIPNGQKVILIMDAGFYEDWFNAVESAGWYWLCRIRGGRSIYINNEWVTGKNFILSLSGRLKDHGEVSLTRRHKHVCRIVSQKKKPKGRHCKTARSDNSPGKASNMYNKSGREPWLLASNLPAEYKAGHIIKLYEKRMQIEESFRDAKSHQFGLGARYIRSKNIDRWAVSMLIATMVQIVYWLVGVVGREQGAQRHFQANSKYTDTVFSNFFLGKLIIKHGLPIKINPRDCPSLVAEGMLSCQ